MPRTTRMEVEKVLRQDHETERILQKLTGKEIHTLTLKIANMMWAFRTAEDPVSVGPPSTLDFSKTAETP